MTNLTKPQILIFKPRERTYSLSGYLYLHMDRFQVLPLSNSISSTVHLISLIGTSCVKIGNVKLFDPSATWKVLNINCSPPWRRIASQ